MCTSWYWHTSAEFTSSFNGKRAVIVLCFGCCGGERFCGFLKRYCSFSFPGLEWNYFEVFIFDVLPTLGSETRLYFGSSSDAVQLPVLSLCSAQPARYAQCYNSNKPDIFSDV